MSDPHKPSGQPTAKPEKPFRMAYVLLWFPLSSETFIFREIVQLEQLGLEIFVYTLYGESFRGCSAEMKNYQGPVTRLGIRSFFRTWGAFFRYLKKSPSLTFRLLRQGFFRKMRNLEALGENLWSFFSGFLIAEQCEKNHIQLIHAPWANGPATSAWIASRLTGIPFAFTGRAGDIYPQDGLLREKSRDAHFIRTNNAANVAWLQKFCPRGEEDKVKLVYNSLTFQPHEQCETPMRAPFHILAVGRFVGKKGFPDLMTAMARLRREGFPVSLTLIGDGAWKRKLFNMRHDLGLADCVSMPGFVPNDRLREIMCSHDLLVVPSVVHSNGDRDGIPNVIMEALSQGMPVIATDVCGIGEVIRNGETGFLVPQHKPAALADAIRAMLEDRENAQKMALAGKKLVEQMFDKNTNIPALRKLYLSTQ